VKLWTKCAACGSCRFSLAGRAVSRHADAAAHLRTALPQNAGGHPRRRQPLCLSYFDSAASGKRGTGRRTHRPGLERFAAPRGVYGEIVTRTGRHKFDDNAYASYTPDSRSLSRPRTRCVRRPVPRFRSSRIKYERPKRLSPARMSASICGSAVEDVQRHRHAGTARPARGKAATPARRALCPKLTHECKSAICWPIYSESANWNTGVGIIADEL